jgi:hypothetical protein
LILGQRLWQALATPTAPVLSPASRLLQKTMQSPGVPGVGWAALWPVTLAAPAAPFTQLLLNNRQALWSVLAPTNHGLLKQLEPRLFNDLNRFISITYQN